MKYTVVAVYGRSVASSNTRQEAKSDYLLLGKDILDTSSNVTV